MSGYRTVVGSLSCLANEKLVTPYEILLVAFLYSLKWSCALRSTAACCMHIDGRACQGATYLATFTSTGF